MSDSSTATPEHKAIVQAFAQACRFGDDQARIDTGAALFQALAASSAKTAEVLVTDAYAAETLKLVCDVFSIGSEARSRSTILANVENAFRRSSCLGAIERQFFITAETDEDDPDGPPFETCLLRWADYPDQYVKRFGAALAATRAQAVSLPAEPEADMFWNYDDPEQQHGSIEEFLNEEICQTGMVEVGAEFTILRAYKLPRIKVRVTAIDEESSEAEFEVITPTAPDSAPVQTKE